MNNKALPKKELGFFPTPLVELYRLSEALGGAAYSYETG